MNSLPFFQVCQPNIEQKGMVWLSPLTRKRKETTALAVLKSDEFFSS